MMDLITERDIKAAENAIKKVDAVTHKNLDEFLDIIYEREDKHREQSTNTREKFYALVQTMITALKSFKAQLSDIDDSNHRHFRNINKQICLQIEDVLHDIKTISH